MRQSRRFSTFDQVLDGLRELRDAGWQIRMVPSYADRTRKRVAMLPPGNDVWVMSRDPLEALLEHFAPGEIFAETINEQAAVLGLPYPAGQWIYALAADDKAHLESQFGCQFGSAFIQQQQKLLDACGLNPRLLPA